MEKIMPIIDILKDTVKHTYGIGLFSKVKITGNSKETSLSAHSDDKNVFLYGIYKNIISDFVDQEIGMSRLDVLKGYCQYPGYADDTAIISIETQTFNKESIPAEIKFKASSGTTSTYRFSSLSKLPKESKKEWNVAVFNGAEFDITFQPSLANLKDLNNFSTILSSYESLFMPETKNGDLYFNIGSGACDRSEILICKDIGFQLTNKMVWKLENVLPILKLGENSTMVLSINDDFLLQIIVDTSIGTYTYLLPAQA